ncbi:GGDEF domain-containing protein [Schauerella aestuarii]|uniref:GGDEF domain-containing protein n=1 Tax=Schauerella aestuarii TaxID=2511204 RepID=UPI001368F6A3|nr:GGDEF domain-containing protein [Achromobacter aestuarii]MYZ44835.1 GGDEF domain-containing protein [Achromobacter aestuarii]
MTPQSLLWITALASVMMTLVAMSLMRSGIPGTRLLVWANLAVIGALVLSPLQQVPSIPAVFTIVLANALMASGLVLVYSAACRFFGYTAARPIWYGAIGMVSGGIAAFYYLWPSLAARVAIASLFAAAVCMAVAIHIYRHRPLGRPVYPYAFTIGVAAFAAVGYTLRAVVYLSGVESPQASLMSATTWNAIFLTVGVLIMPSLTIGMIMMVHDRMLADREREANVDELTHAATRKAWWSAAQRCLRATERSGKPMSLLMLDIDLFKQLNDTYGHGGGDAVLKHLAALGRAVLRPEDLLGRFGGEEFVVLFSATAEADAAAMTQRWVEAVRITPCAYDGKILNYTFSAGLTTWKRGDTLQALVQRADLALYASKADGRDRVTLRTA